MSTIAIQERAKANSHFKPVFDRIRAMGKRE
jgi:hypothetical protein